MAKGFKDSRGKFRPTGSRGKSSRQKSVETIGMKINDVDISEQNWGFEAENGMITKLRLGNSTDAGWNWDGDASDIFGFLIRVDSSDIKSEFLQKMREEGINYTKLKPVLLENLTGDWLYEISGDNSRWHFHQDDDGELIDQEIQYYLDENKITDDDIEAINEELWNHNTRYEFEDFLKDNEDWLREQMEKIIKENDTFEQFFNAIEESGIIDNIEESFYEGQRNKAGEVVSEAISKLKEEGKITVSKGEEFSIRSQKTEEDIEKGLQVRLAKNG